MPWKSHILNLATKGVREAASAITLNDYQSQYPQRPVCLCEYP